MTARALALLAAIALTLALAAVFRQDAVGAALGRAMPQAAQAASPSGLSPYGSSQSGILIAGDNR